MADIKFDFSPPESLQRFRDLVETLVELDHEYREVAFEAGCPVYVRVPALGVAPGFIGGLGRLVETAVGSPDRSQGSNAQGARA